MPNNERIACCHVPLLSLLRKRTFPGQFCNGEAHLPSSCRNPDFSSVAILQHLLIQMATDLPSHSTFYPVYCFSNSSGGSEPSSADSSRTKPKSAAVVKLRNYSAPGIRNTGGPKKAASIQNRALPSLRETKKKPLRKKSDHTDPFQNFGMPLERF